MKREKATTRCGKHIQTPPPPLWLIEFSLLLGMSEVLEKDYKILFRFKIWGIDIVFSTNCIKHDFKLNQLEIGAFHRVVSESRTHVHLQKQRYTSTKIDHLKFYFLFTFFFLPPRVHNVIYLFAHEVHEKFFTSFIKHIPSAYRRKSEIFFFLFLPLTKFSSIRSTRKKNFRGGVDSWNMNKGWNSQKYPLVSWGRGKEVTTQYIG